MSKKTATEIENDILEFLKDGPKTITELKNDMKSNWLTVEKFLKKLSDEDKVKEIISTDKKKVYQRVYSDTYFDVPITTKDRQMFNSLYSLILSKYKVLERIPTKTEFAKVAVDVIEKSEELKDLPRIWYLYGMIPLKAAEPSQEYFKEITFKNELEIVKFIADSIKDKKDKSSITIQQEQHKRFREWTYINCDQFMKETKDWNDKKILDALNEIYISCPIDDEFKIFDFFDKFNTVVGKLSVLGKLNEYKNEIIITFDSLYKYYTTYRAYKSFQELNFFKNNNDLLNFYIGNSIDSRATVFDECFSDLNSIYLSNLNKNVKLKLSEDALEVRNIFEDLN
ncbi:hypothetical protein KAS08_02585 [Candidatus Pacearchaeota archaeon]|nr:hypothetical protein [Candidatus Pacearchaeota archaeon]